VAGFARRAIVVIKQREAGRRDDPSPGGEIIETGVALVRPALLVPAARVGAEQHPLGLERRPQTAQHPRQFLAWNMEQDGIREDAIEVPRRQIHCQHVLQPDLAARRGARHVDEFGAGVQADRFVPAIAKGDQVPAGTAAEIEDPAWRRAADRAEQSGDVLADVVAPGAVAIGICEALVVRDRAGADGAELIGVEVRDRLQHRHNLQDRGPLPPASG
jgi:hypothetical protein